MVARALNVPHLNVLDDQGQVMASGRLKLYEPGTSTPKVAYKNAAATTSYGSQIELDAAGRPEDGAIYFDGLYKVEVYSNSGGTYTLEHTVDNFGEFVTASVATSVTHRILNGSFEADTNADGEPDDWTLTNNSGNAGRNVTENYHGTASMELRGTGVSQDELLSALFEVSPGFVEVLSFAIKASNALAEPAVEVTWYDKDQSSISTSTVFSSDTGNTPTSWEYKTGLVMTPPSTARYASIKLIGNQAVTSYTTYFDDVRVAREEAINSSFAIRGLTLSNNGTDPDHDIDISEGECRDDTNTVNIKITADITKQADATWAYGDNAGGMSSATLGTDIYAVWAIHNSTTGESDICFTEGVASFASPTLPTGYDYKRLIGFFNSDGSNNVLSFTHSGNYFRFDDPLADLNDTTMTNNTFETATLRVAPNCIAWIYARTYNSTAQDVSNIVIRPVGAADAVPTDGTESILIRAGKPASGNSAITVPHHVLVDASCNIEYAVEEGGGTQIAVIRTFGCTMLTRDNPV